MSVVICSAVTLGLQVVPVSIEAALGSGFSGVQLIGLPQEYARDARERIRAAIEGLGISLPARRLIVSIRPSETLKQFKTGLEHLDLACAVAILAALAQQQNVPRINCGNLKKIVLELSKNKHLFAGQITLAGEILPLENPLPFEILALKKETTHQIIWCNYGRITHNQQTTSSFHRTTSLQHCLQLLSTGSCVVEATEEPSVFYAIKNTDESINATMSNHEIINERQNTIRSALGRFEHIPVLGLALCLAAAGRHHLLLAGSPGCGKTFALRNLRHLLPPLLPEEKMDVALVQNRSPHDVKERPFRSPHHSASSAALLGGSLLQPGEVSLAHHGTPFLDELAEFPRPSLEALREPLDEEKISLSRARGRVELPAKFQLLAATNPCPCGYVFSRTRQCRCAVGAPLKYQQKLSGPLLERFSILLLVDDLIERDNNFTATEQFDSLKSLKKLGYHWLRVFRQNQLEWAKHFIEVQNSLWKTTRDAPRVSEVNEALSRRSVEKDWSARTHGRISSLLVTLTTLFKNEFHCNLSNDEWVAVAEELRGLEQTLQLGVQLLTPLTTPQLLKKGQPPHDTTWYEQS